MSDTAAIPPTYIVDLHTRQGYNLKETNVIPDETCSTFEVPIGYVISRYSRWDDQVYRIREAKGDEVNQCHIHPALPAGLDMSQVLLRPIYLREFSLMPLGNPIYQIFPASSNVPSEVRLWQPFVANRHTFYTPRSNQRTTTEVVGWYDKMMMVINPIEYRGMIFHENNSTDNQAILGRIIDRYEYARVSLNLITDMSGMSVPDPDRYKDICVPLDPTIDLSGLFVIAPELEENELDDFEDGFQPVPPIPKNLKMRSFGLREDGQFVLIDGDLLKGAILQKKDDVCTFIGVQVGNTELIRKFDGCEGLMLRRFCATAHNIVLDETRVEGYCKSPPLPQRVVKT